MSDCDTLVGYNKYTNIFMYNICIKGRTMDNKLNKPRTQEEQESAYQKAWDYEPSAKTIAKGVEAYEEYLKNKNKK